ncbi:non-structural polyprotein [Bat dicibavirus]|uniref:non-structural polyprotein n=1 Tax=Bat dicibavirus TaxID=1958784 RepID=UPI000983B4CB|nr:non-structural polyprotein [Bat dicibavirus]AQP31142.1 non-structural polyprotein [Bat dicibavirus]
MPHLQNIASSESPPLLNMYYRFLKFIQKVVSESVTSVESNQRRHFCGTDLMDRGDYGYEPEGVEYSPQESTYFSQHLPQGRNVVRNLCRMTDNICPDMDKESATNCLSLESQAGEPAEAEDVISATKDFISANNLPFSEEILDKVEGAVLLFVALRKATDSDQFASIILMYAKTLVRGSLFARIAKFMHLISVNTFDVLSKEEKEEALEEQAGISTSPVDWVTYFRQANANWNMFVKCPGFEKISRLISVCMSLGLLNSKSIDIDFNGIKLFTMKAMERQATALDFMDALFQTLAYLIEGGYECFKLKSMMPLMYNDPNAMSDEAKYDKLVDNFEYCKTGDLERLAGIDPNDYAKMLYDLEIHFKTCAMGCANPLATKLYLGRAKRLHDLHVQYNQIRAQGGLRIEPVCFKVFGQSAVGKSTVSQLLMINVLKYCGFDASDTRVASINESDKFDSNLRSDVNGIYIDDMANTAVDFVERSPCAKLIELKNNVRITGNMAEADMKGKVTLEPKCLCITTNVKDTMSHKYSNEPISVDRRFDLIITVKVREEFAKNGIMLDKDAVERHYKGNIPYFPDIWDFTIESVYPIPNPTVGKPVLTGYEVVKDEVGEPMEDIGIHQLIYYCTEFAKKHFEQQKSLLDRSANLSDKLQFCNKCNYARELCCCECEKCKQLIFKCACNIEPHFGPAFVPNIAKTVLTSYMTKKLVYGNAFDGYVKRVDESVTSYLIENMQLLERMFFNKIVDVAPTSMLQSSYAKEFILWTMRGEAKDYVWWLNIWMTGYWLAFTVLLIFLRMFFPLWLSPLFYLGCWQSAFWFVRRMKICKPRFVTYRRSWKNILLTLWLWIAVTFISIVLVLEKDDSRLYYYLFFYINFLNWTVLMYQCVYIDMINRATSRRDCMSVFEKKCQQDRHNYILGTCVVFGTLYALYSLWKSIRVVHKFVKVEPATVLAQCVDEAQANLVPVCMDDISKRDAEENPWKNAPQPIIAEKPKISHRCDSMTHAEVKDTIYKNTCFMTCKVNEKKFSCDCVFIRSNVALVPNHIWTTFESAEAEFLRHGGNVIGGNFRAWISEAHSYHIPDTDFSLVWIPNGGDWKDITHLFPESFFKDGAATLVYKDKDGARVESGLMYRNMTVRTALCTKGFVGAEYMTNMPTFVGLCMATLVSDSVSNFIVGFHLAGKSGTSYGACGTLFKQQIEQAVCALKEVSGVLLCKSKGILPETIYDVQVCTSENVHPRSPLNFLPEKSNCLFYGECPGRASTYSKCKPTCISEIVEEVSGVPNYWGAPQFHKNYPWQASLAHSSNTSPGLPGELLSTACEDYLYDVRRIFSRIPSLKDEVRPLTDEAIVNGIDGRRFIDRIVTNTSPGFPLGGAKSRFFTDIAPTETATCNRILDTQFWLEARKAEECYRKGQRYYAIFKGCLKDEPTLKTKTKVRVFQAAPLAFSLLVRKYFLSIVRIMSLNPLESECAVGVNSQGPEWDQLARHMMKFGEDRILAGDYSKYDLRMPAQLIQSAFWILIQIAQQCGYSDDDIVIMEGIASDISLPLVAYNGDLIQLFGSNPSGHNLTVYINSIVNSLLLRCAYYDIEGVASPHFSSRVAIMTYGDDVKGSVSPVLTKYNHLTVAEFLGKYDIVFTMPDKESVPTPFMSDKDADFLKRKNVFNDELGIYMGCLEEMSIYKSLHCVLASKSVTPREVAAMNIGGALREWFQYGRDYYDDKLKQMRLIAERANLTHMIPELEFSYDYLLDNFRAKYLTPVEYLSLQKGRDNVVGGH